MSSNHPKVSVVIPCYNDKDYIQETVQSVLYQTFQDFEILIVDDGSSLEDIIALETLIDKLKSQKEPVQLIKHKVNLGFSSAVNSGVKSSNADFIV